MIALWRLAAAYPAQTALAAIFIAIRITRYAEITRTAPATAATVTRIILAATLLAMYATTANLRIAPRLILARAAFAPLAKDP